MLVAVRVMLPPAVFEVLLVVIVRAPASVMSLTCAPPVPEPPAVFTVIVIPVPLIAVASPWLNPWAPEPS